MGIPMRSSPAQCDRKAQVLQQVDSIFGSRGSRTQHQRQQHRRPSLYEEMLEEVAARTRTREFDEMTIDEDLEVDVVGTQLQRQSQRELRRQANLRPFSTEVFEVEDDDSDDDDDDDEDAQYGFRGDGINSGSAGRAYQEDAVMAGRIVDGNDTVSEDEYNNQVNELTTRNLSARRQQQQFTAAGVPVSAATRRQAQQLRAWFDGSSRRMVPLSSSAGLLTSQQQPDPNPWSGINAPYIQPMSSELSPPHADYMSFTPQQPRFGDMYARYTTTTTTSGNGARHAERGLDEDGREYTRRRLNNGHYASSANREPVADRGDGGYTRRRVPGGVRSTSGGNYEADLSALVHQLREQAAIQPQSVEEPHRQQQISSSSSSRSRPHRRVIRPSGSMFRRRPLDHGVSGAGGARQDHMRFGTFPPYHSGRFGQSTAWTDPSSSSSSPSSNSLSSSTSPPYSPPSVPPEFTSAEALPPPLTAEREWRLAPPRMHTWHHTPQPVSQQRFLPDRSHGRRFQEARDGVSSGSETCSEADPEEVGAAHGELAGPVASPHGAQNMIADQFLNPMMTEDSPPVSGRLIEIEDDAEVEIRDTGAPSTPFVRHVERLDQHDDQSTFSSSRPGITDRRGITDHTQPAGPSPVQVHTLHTSSITVLCRSDEALPVQTGLLPGPTAPPSALSQIRSLLNASRNQNQAPTAALGAADNSHAASSRTAAVDRRPPEMGTFIHTVHSRHGSAASASVLAGFNVAHRATAGENSASSGAGGGGGGGTDSVERLAGFPQSQQQQQQQRHSLTYPNSIQNLPNLIPRAQQHLQQIIRQNPNDSANRSDGVRPPYFSPARALRLHIGEEGFASVALTDEYIQHLSQHRHHYGVGTGEGN